VALREVATAFYRARQEHSGAGLLVAPLIAFFVTAVLLSNADGSRPYFEAVSQIIPLLVVALVIEGDTYGQEIKCYDCSATEDWTGWSRALTGLARESDAQFGVGLTAGGVVALVISVLVPLKAETQGIRSEPNRNSS
jgi:hypothetical protein